MICMIVLILTKTRGMTYTIVGCGAAGIQLCLELLKHGIPPSSITIIDAFFDGGALLRSWGAISSNTTWQQILDTLQEYTLVEPHIKELSEKYTSADRILLADLGHLLQKTIQSFPDEIRFIQDTCTCIQQTSSGWRVSCKSSNHMSDVVFLCQGGQPKQFDVGKPTIPLEVALDPSRLTRYVRPHHRIVVFGLAHSGTLVLKSLLQTSCSITGVYKSKTPFQFARDGHYDGIKQESAEIADDILKTAPSCLELVSFSEFSKVVKAVQRAHWIIPTVGFVASPIQIKDLSGQPIPYEVYSPETSQLQEGLYGFGLAYPGVTDGIYKDVSLPSFKVQIQRCLPSVLTKIRNGLPLDGAKQNNQ
jgi:hypothetical protein